MNYINHIKEKSLTFRILSGAGGELLGTNQRLNPQMNIKRRCLQYRSLRQRQASEAKE
jgi:hypothetical protein